MAYDRTKPASSSALSSAEMRSNFQGLETPMACFERDLFTMWPAGTAAAPWGWVISGTGAGVAQESNATFLNGMGPYACKLTYGSAAAQLEKTLLSTTAFLNALRGKTVSFAINCYGSAGSVGRVQVYDGVDTTSSGYAANGSHTWLTLTHTFNASATQLVVRMRAEAAGSAYFQGLCGGFGDVTPPAFNPGMFITQRPVMRDLHLVGTDAWLGLGSVPRIIHADGAAYKAGTPADNTGTGWTMTVPAGLLKNDGDALRVHLIQKSFGSANTPTENKLKFGATPVVLALRHANDASKINAMWTGLITRRNSTTVRMAIHGGSYVPASATPYAEGTETFANALTLTTTHGSSAGVSDYLQQEYVSVEYLPAPLK